jgi:hypothetical protein
MAKYKENRLHRRFEHEAQIIVQSRRTRGDCFSGRMYNFSKDGLYIETDFAGKPGDEITIMVENPPYGSGPYLHRAEVKWSAELPDAMVFYRYGMGAQYDLTVDYSLHRSELPFKKRSGEDRRTGQDRRSGSKRRKQDLLREQLLHLHFDEKRSDEESDG